MGNENLIKLVYHLWNDVQQSEFDMGAYVKGVGYIQGATCALGRAGDIIKKYDDETWHDYSVRVFDIPGEKDGGDPVWEWIFAPEWEYIDNTPRGAAKRIIYYLLDNEVYSIEEVIQDHWYYKSLYDY